MKKPHKYAEVVKAWADGEAVEYRNRPTDDWVTVSQVNFFWAADVEYRIKPKPEYPTTLMTGRELFMVYCGANEGPTGHKDYVAVANAAIRHAIDSCQVIIAPKGE